MRKWIEQKLRLSGPIPESVPTPELVEYVGMRAIGPLLRGALWKWRFRSCGARPLIGKNTSIYFPGHLSLGERVQIGPHCMINALSKNGMKIGGDVRIRDYTWIQATSQLNDPGEGLEIGDGTYIGPYCFLGAGGGIKIGKNVLSGACVHFLAENHKFDEAGKNINEQGVSRKGIVVEDNVWIGNQVLILDGVRIGQGSIVAAGAVVTHDVAPMSIVGGNPAKLIRSR